MRRQKPTDSTFVTGWIEGVGPPWGNPMPEYVERPAVLGLLAAAQDQQDDMARQEEEKSAGSIPTITKHRHAAEVLVSVADAVRDLAAAPVKGEKEV